MRRPSLILTSVVAVATFSLLAAGCGDVGESPGVANNASTTTTPTTGASTGPLPSALVAFSQ